MLAELVGVAFSESLRPDFLLVLLEVLGELIELWTFGIGGISLEELGRAKRGESGGGTCRLHLFETVVLAWSVTFCPPPGAGPDGAKPAVSGILLCSARIAGTSSAHVWGFDMPYKCFSIVRVRVVIRFA